ncbi:hypothetical protein [Achromobacter ruhlandii]|uniref:hypothetical protein n=1 Tax=Achromobacter ruhlandii TaxID=72557 RepID=UPI003BA18DD6
MSKNLDRKLLLQKEIEKEEQYIKDRKIVFYLCVLTINILMVGQLLITTWR